MPLFVSMQGISNARKSHCRITVISSRKQTKIKHLSKHGLLEENYLLFCEITTWYSLFLYNNAQSRHIPIDISHSHCDVPKICVQCYESIHFTIKMFLPSGREKGERWKSSVCWSNLMKTQTTENEAKQSKLHNAQTHCKNTCKPITRCFSCF